MHGPKTSKDWKRQKLPERLLDPLDWLGAVCPSSVMVVRSFDPSLFGYGWVRIGSTQPTFEYG